MMKSHLIGKLLSNMFTAIESRIIEILKTTLPEELVAEEQILAGPAAEPAKLPAIVFSAGDFEIIPDDRIMNVVRQSEELLFRVSLLLEVWAETTVKVEEIALKAMAAIFINRAEIENKKKMNEHEAQQNRESEEPLNGSFKIGDKLQLSFDNSNLAATSGMKIVKNGSPAKIEVAYSMQSEMTVTRLHFDYQKIEDIHVALQKPNELASLKKPIELASFKKPPLTILDKPVVVMKRVGKVTSDKLAQKGIVKIRELALATADELSGDIRGIENLIERAKEIRRISSAVSLETASRKPPFTLNISKLKLPDVLKISSSEIADQTGKSLEEARSLQDNLEILAAKLIDGDEFEQLTLQDFL